MTFHPHAHTHTHTHTLSLESLSQYYTIIIIIIIIIIHLFLCGTENGIEHVSSKVLYESMKLQQCDNFNLSVLFVKTCNLLQKKSNQHAKYS